MSTHDYAVISTVVFGVLTIIWSSSNAPNFLVKLVFGVLTITGIFLLAGVK